MIAILCALDVEVQKFYDLVENPVVEELYGYRFMSGRLQGRDVVVVRCGMGKVNAAVCAQTLLMRYQPELVINSGVAGSLSPALNICDIVIGTDAVQHDVDTTALGDPIGMVSTVYETYFPCDERAGNVLLKAAEKLGVHAVRARIASGDQFIAETEKKRWIVDTFAASACEMEGGAIAQVCFISKVPCVILRAISDSTDGSHRMEYEQFMGIAAENSCKVLCEALKDL